MTSIKIDIFSLVTTRPIAHQGRFACIRNCVGEFGTGTGQPLVNSNVMSYDILGRPSWGRELTCKIIPISIGGL